MKRLLSVILSILLVFSFFLTMTACNNKEENINRTTYDFKGLKVSLPKEYKLVGQDDDFIVFQYDDRYIVQIQTSNMYTGMDANAICDAQFEVLESDGILSKGNANGTPYIYVKNGEFSKIASFYSSPGGRSWCVLIGLYEDDYYDKYFDKELMINTITGWECQ